MKPFAIALASLLALSGCAGSQALTPRAHTVSSDGQAYAAALAEAFSTYEQEVQTALALTYASQAEARAVIATLSESYFDWQLKQALARRGLTTTGLAEYAAEHPDFFHDQQRTYWGRLEQLQNTLAALPDSVMSNADSEDVMLASEMATPAQQ